MVERLAEHTPLSLAFMRGHPAQAARELEALPVAEVGTLLERTPARLGAAVLEAMLPRRAALCLERIDDERALELLASMPTQPMVALLRHLPESRRRLLLAGLPTAAALASTLLIGYGGETLGAWADPDVVLLPAETSAGAALERMRAAAATHPMVFVAGPDRRLLGSVDLARLLRAPAAASLASLMRPPPARLAAHAPLAATAAHPGWQLASALPVLEPGDRLVGILTRDALARALRRSAPGDAGSGDGDSADGHHPASLPALLATGYWRALSGLLRGGLALLPVVRPVVARPPEAAPPPPPA